MEEKLADSEDTSSEGELDDLEGLCLDECEADEGDSSSEQQQ